MVSSSDAELAQHALAGSQDAYGLLVSRYAGPAIGLAVRIVRDRALAEDLVQEAFTRAFSRLETYNGVSRFSSWFFRILHNVAVDHLRKKRVASISMDELADAGHPGFEALDEAPADEQLERAALQRALDRSLGQLRPEYREAVILRYHQELSVEEVAEVMDIPEGTVKTFLFRARKELAAALKAQGWGEQPAGDRA